MVTLTSQYLAKEIGFLNKIKDHIMKRKNLLLTICLAISGLAGITAINAINGLSAVGVKAEATKLKTMQEIAGSRTLKIALAEETVGSITYEPGDLSNPWRGDYPDIATSIAIEFLLFDAGTTQAIDVIPTVGTTITTVIQSADGVETNSVITAALKTASFASGHYVGVKARYVPLSGYEETYSAGDYVVFQNSYLYEPFNLQPMSTLNHSLSISESGDLDYPWLSDALNAQGIGSGLVQVEFGFFSVGATQVSTPTIDENTVYSVSLFQPNSAYVTDAMILNAFTEAMVMSTDYFGVAARYAPIDGVENNPYTSPSAWSVFASSHQYSLTSIDVLLNKSTIASDVGQGASAQAVDGNDGTLWGTTAGLDDQWILIDTKKAVNISEVKLYWEGARPQNYEVYFGFPTDVDVATFDGKTDGQFWGAALITRTGAPLAAGTDTFPADGDTLSGDGRYFLIVCHNPTGDNAWGMKLFTANAYGTKLTNSPAYYTFKNYMDSLTCDYMNANAQTVSNNVAADYAALSDADKTLLRNETFNGGTSYLDGYAYVVKYTQSKLGSGSSIAIDFDSENTKNILLYSLLGLAGASTAALFFLKRKKKSS